MLKLKYAIYEALLNFNIRRGVNIIVLVSFALGMILPILCLGNINIFVENISTLRLKDDNNVSVAFFDGAVVPIGEITSSLQECNLKICNYAIYAQKRGIVEINGRKTSLFIDFLTEEWLEFERCKIIEGSLYLFSGDNVCLVEKSLSDAYGGLRVGDTVTISGDIYTVTGIISSFRHYGKIILPIIRDDDSSAYSDLVISRLFLRMDGNILDDGNASAVLMRTDLPVTDVRGGEELYRIDLKEGFLKSTGIFLAGLVAFVFSAINICLVLTGKMNLDKRNIGIRVALGASTQLIFMSALFENLFCYCIAYLCDIGLVYLLRPTYPEGLTVILNARVFIVALIFGIFMTVLVTFIVTFKLRRKKCVELFERVS